jgi:hypothetical protein
MLDCKTLANHENFCDAISLSKTFSKARIAFDLKGDAFNAKTPLSFFNKQDAACFADPCQNSNNLAFYD